MGSAPSRQVFAGGHTVRYNINGSNLTDRSSIFLAQASEGVIHVFFCIHQDPSDSGRIWREEKDYTQNWEVYAEFARVQQPELRTVDLIQATSHEIPFRSNSIFDSARGIYQSITCMLGRHDPEWFMEEEAIIFGGLSGRKEARFHEYHDTMPIKRKQRPGEEPIYDDYTEVFLLRCREPPFDPMTLGGDSGSPVCMLIRNQYVLVGVVVAGGPNRSGVPVTAIKLVHELRDVLGLRWHR